MKTNHPRIYQTPLVTEKLPSWRATPPPTQRELVMASLLARPSSPREESEDRR